MSEITREEIQAQIAASEARGDTKFAQLEGKIDVLMANIQSGFAAATKDAAASVRASDELKSAVRESKWVLFGTTIGAAIALAALFVGVITYGDAIFSRGMAVRDVVQSVITENASHAAKEITKPKQP